MMAPNIEAKRLGTTSPPSDPVEMPNIDRDPRIIIECDTCGLCRHYLERATCRAFPEGIPPVVFDGIHDHRFPFPGDGGITFELDPVVVDRRRRRGYGPAAELTGGR